MSEAGIKLGTLARAAFAYRVRELAGDGRRVMAIVEPLLVLLANTPEQLARLTKQVLDIVREDKVCQRLMRVPPSGNLLAAEGHYHSGETDIQGRISADVSRPGANEFARTGLVETAHTLLVRSSKSSALYVWGLPVARRCRIARAKGRAPWATGSPGLCSAARKLAVILHNMWSDGTDFCFNKDATGSDGNRQPGSAK